MLSPSEGISTLRSSCAHGKDSPGIAVAVNTRDFAGPATTAFPRAELRREKSLGVEMAERAAGEEVPTTAFTLGDAKIHQFHMQDGRVRADAASVVGQWG